MVQVNKRSGVETKGQILDAAMKVFSTYGYAGANIRAIARAAGISIGGVYLYFRNKEELYLDLLNARIGEQLLKTKETVAGAGSPEDALNAFITLYLEHGLKDRELILINIREHRYSFGRDIKKKFLHSQVQLLKKILSDGIRDREFRECNKEEAAKIIMATLRGVVLSMVIEDESVVTSKGLSDFVLNGILRKDRKDFVKKLRGHKNKQILRKSKNGEIKNKLKNEASHD